MTPSTHRSYIWGSWLTFAVARVVDFLACTARNAAIHVGATIKRAHRVQHKCAVEGAHVAIYLHKDCRACNEHREKPQWLSSATKHHYTWKHELTAVSHLHLQAMCYGKRSS